VEIKRKTCQRHVLPSAAEPPNSSLAPRIKSSAAGEGKSNFSIQPFGASTERNKRDINLIINPMILRDP